MLRSQILFYLALLFILAVADGRCQSAKPSAQRRESNPSMACPFAQKQAAGGNALPTCNRCGIRERNSSVYGANQGPYVGKTNPSPSYGAAKIKTPESCLTPKNKRCSRFFFFPSCFPLPFSFPSYFPRPLFSPLLFPSHSCLFSFSHFCESCSWVHVVAGGAKGKPPVHTNDSPFSSSLVGDQVWPHQQFVNCRPVQKTGRRTGGENAAGAVAEEN